MKKQLLLLLATFGVLRLSAQNATQVNVSATATSSTITNNVATAVDPNLTVTANGNINGFIVSISDSYTSGDVLSYTGSLPSGVTAVAFNTTTRSLVFNGSTSAANWQALLRTVTLQTTSATCFPESRKVSFNAGNKYYNALNGHFYEYYSTAQTWLNAKAYAATQSYFGREGYLATATSLAENNFIWKIIGNDVWIGASYDYNELTACGVTAYANQAAAISNTYWVTGPEKGTYISSGLSSPVAQNNQFANWNNGEPNNSGNEYYVELYVGQSGKWNDLGAGSTLGALIEYGGMPNDNTTSTVVATRTVLVNGAPSGTVSGGNVTVCSGTNSTTLTLGGFTGSVVRWESSVDNFLTTPTTISSTSTTYTATNLTQTTYYRAIVNTTSPATCSSLNTSSTPVNVTATVTGNITAANSSICPNSQAGLTLFGNTGNILKWQVSTSSNFSSGVTDISNTTNNLSYTLASAGTYYFRAQVQASGCGTASFSPSCTVTVTAGTPPVGGTVTSTEHCAGSNSGTLTLSGYTGTISKWQYSTDGIIWTDVANTTATLSYTGVTTTRQYRAVLTNGSCGSVNSAAGTVTVYGNTAYQWLGTTNTASSTATNWKCSTTPPTGVDVVISSTASNDLVLDQSYSFGNVDMSNSTRNIILGNYDLTVTSITGANASHYIKTTGTGKLKIAVANGTSFTAPVGNSAYNPVTITNNTGAADNFAIKIYDEVYQYGTTGNIVPQAHVKRTWDISKTNPNGGSGISFVFNWNAGETSAAMTTPVLYHYGPTWSKQTGTTSVTSTSLTYSNYLGTFSPFVVAEGSGYPLPITWVSFTANKQGKTAVLSWTTANEKNTKDYTIQRSTNGNNWENIGTKIATGNLSMAQQYDYTDLHPVNGNNYYRILQADIDGSTTYSSIARINFAENGHQFSVYPNPVINGLLNVTSGEDATAVVYNNMGMKVYEQEIKAGTTQLTLPSLAHGVYLIKAGDATASFVVE